MSFETKYGKFMLGDAKELIKGLDDNSIDVIITDPPFGFKLDEYDDDKVLFELESEFYRVLKPNSWFVFYYSVQKLPDITKFEYFKYSWLLINYYAGSYYKSHIGSRNYTPIVVMKKGEPKVAYRRHDVLFADELPLVKGKVKNPIFKPTLTTTFLLHMFSNEDSLVLDPFAGFGSIPLVCQLFKRRWLAFEIDKWKFKIAKKFIESMMVSTIPRLDKKVI